MLTRTQEVNTQIWKTITKLRSEKQDKLPTEAELCEMLGASRITIRRAMQELVNNGILKRIQGKGTFIAEQRTEDVVSTGKIPLIGLACDTLQFNDYMIRIVKGIVKAAHDKGLEVMVCSFGGRSMINSWLPTQQGPAEFVGFISPEFEKNTIDLLDKRRIPYVALLREQFEQQAKYAIIGKKGMQRCIEYLHKLGHDRICFVESQCNLYNMDEAKRISRSFQQQGDDVTIMTKECGYLPDRTMEVIDDILRLDENSRPTGFLCKDDMIAAWVINHFKRRGYSVPKDFSVIGIGNFTLGLCIDPQITTASISYDQLGEMAVDMFVKQLNGESIENPIQEVDHSIIERQSCGPVRS